MEYADLDRFNYAAFPARPSLRGTRPAPSCRRKLFLQRHVSGDIFPLLLQCGSNRCPDCGTKFRREHLDWLYQCFTIAALPLHVGGVEERHWEAVRRYLQRHELLFVWVKDITGLRLLVATGSFALSAGGRAPEVPMEAALGLFLLKLRDVHRLASNRFLDACEQWRQTRPRREPPTSRRLGWARRGAREDELIDIARELHLARGGSWPASAPHPIDLSPNDFGDLFAEAINEDWERVRRRR